MDMSVRVTFSGLHGEGQPTPNMGGTIHRVGPRPAKETPSWAAVFLSVCLLQRMQCDQPPHFVSPNQPFFLPLFLSQR